jgi:hypothetical protein
MMGIHGNGLTHEMWMPENSTLIEVSFASLKNKVKMLMIDVPSRHVLERLSVRSSGPESSIFCCCEFLEPGSKLC